MAALEILRHITKEEIAQKCILLEDDKGKPLQEGLKDPVVLVSGSHRYMAEIHDFYLKERFRKGLLFPDAAAPDGKSFEPFFAASLTQNTRITLRIDPEQREADGCLPVELLKA